MSKAWIDNEGDKRAAAKLREHIARSKSPAFVNQPVKQSKKRTKRK